MCPADAQPIERDAEPVALADGLAELRAIVAAAVDDGHGGRGAPAAAAPDGGLRRRIPGVRTLVEGFGLSAFEGDLLLLSAGAELDPDLAELIRQRTGRPLPTLGFALAHLPGAHWSAIFPDGALLRWGLIELSPGAPMSARTATLDPRVLQVLLGIPGLDPRLRSRLQPLEVPSITTPPEAEAAATLEGLWAPSADGAAPGNLQLFGPDPGAARRVAAAAARALGVEVMALAAEDIPAQADEREALCRLWLRESRLTGVRLLIEVGDDRQPSLLRGVQQVVDRLGGGVVLGASEPIPLAAIQGLVEVRDLTVPERAALWRDLLGGEVARIRDLTEVSAHFRLDCATVRSAAVVAGAELRAGPQARGARLWGVCRRHARPRLDQLAQRLHSRVGWRDLVLPDFELETLGLIVTHFRQQRRVYDDWGFADRGSRGLGLSALFSGPSGTGKTLAAEVIAAALEVDCYRVDLSAVVSKYIGETEKHLRQVFDAAERSCVVLLFDEADALFGKRSEVKDSLDRYANIEVGYLLQRFESYRGLAILTTNLKSSLDTAFMRRLRFVVDFKFPDVAQRQELWARVFPPQAPTAGLNPSALAALELSGGEIRNVALAAAMLAAEEDQAVNMVHLRRAAQQELAKNGRRVSASQLRGWS